MGALPDAVVFDWDNTLVESWSAIAEAMNFVRAELGFETWSMDQVKKNCTRAARESFPDWYGGQWERAYALYYQRFNEIRQSTKMVTLPGAENLIRYLNENEVPMVVVSNKKGDILRSEVELLSWTDLFEAVVGAQDAKLDKPARDPVDLALGKAGLKAHAGIWFVGDSDVDMQCARNAGCTPVYIGNRENATRLCAARVYAGCHELFEMIYNGSN